MSLLLVAYEDRYCRELDRTIRRAVKEDGPLAVPREFHPVEGVTNFQSFVKKTWPRFRDTGFPQRGKPKPTALLCVADADVIAKQLGLTVRTKPYDEWILQAEREFTDRLRQDSEQPEQIHGVLLRWNLESTLIAGFDEREAMRCLAGRVPLDDARLDEFISGCRPDPRATNDDNFTNTFDSPQACLRKLAATLGWQRLKKGDSRKDDALDWLTKNRLNKLLARVPDLRRVAALVRTIALP